MKKIISLFLAVIMCFALAACGSKGISKEEMLAQAVEIDDYRSEMMGNFARAEEKYVGNIYYITGHVSDITGETLEVGDFTVNLPKEDIMKVTTGQRIKIVGKIDSISYEQVPNEYGFEHQCKGVMSNAYFVTDILEITGTLRFYYTTLRDIDGRVHNRNGNPDAWLIGLDLTDDSYLTVDYSLEESIPVNHISGKDITSVQFGGKDLTDKTEITVSGKVFYENNKYVIKEAELISVN